jgi:hypothetical protein
MELNMNTIIDLASEVLIDRSQVQNPYLRLLLTSLGREVAKGSAWVAINKRVASHYDVLSRLILKPARCVVA